MFVDGAKPFSANLNVRVFPVNIPDVLVFTDSVCVIFFCISGYPLLQRWRLYHKEKDNHMNEAYFCKSGFLSASWYRCQRWWGPSLLEVLYRWSIVGHPTASKCQSKRHQSFKGMNMETCQQRKTHLRAAVYIQQYSVHHTSRVSNNRTEMG